MQKKYTLIFRTPADFGKNFRDSSSYMKAGTSFLKRASKRIFRLKKYVSWKQTGTLCTKFFLLWEVVCWLIV
jgi:hypothetical protein